MVTYKRGAWSLIKSLGIAIIAPVALAFIIDWFTQNPLIVLGIPAVILVFLLFTSIFSENIKIELDGNTLRYYKRNKLKGEYDLLNSDIRLRTRTNMSAGTSSREHYLYITPAGGSEDYIDCSPLGFKQSNDLFERIQQIVPFETPKLQAKKLGAK